MGLERAEANIPASGTERVRRAREALSRHGLQALVCRLPENIVMLSGYWPVIGRSALVLPVEGNPVLLAPAMEEQALRRSFVQDVRTFPVWKLQDPAPDESLFRLLAELASEQRWKGHPVGIDSGFEDIAPSQKVLEPWAAAEPSRQLVERVGGRPVDATELLMELRATKTDEEIERIRTASEIARFGIAAFFRAVAPGRREFEIAADVEAAIVRQGTGYKGTVHARGQALVFSGTERLHQVGWGYAPNSTRALQAGDLVMLELCTVADGYYSDLTRMAVVGTPSADQQKLLQAVEEAQQAAIRVVRPGVTGKQVDQAAREVLRRYGLDEAFCHITGHGLGFRYHERYPLLAPGSEDILLPGMVMTVEPGVYAPEFGGVRIEDNVVVTENGCEVISG